MPYKDKEKEKAYNRTEKRKASRREQYYKKASTPEGRARLRVIQNKSDAKRIKNSSQRRREGYKERRWEKNLMSLYALSRQQYDEMLASQNFGCAICGKDSWVERCGKLTVDHDHETGRVRGLLCTNCNTGLGLFKDSPNHMTRAIQYLKETV